MTVWKLTQEQKEKYKKIYNNYIEEYAEEFTYDFIDEVVKNFNELKLTINQYVTDFKKKSDKYEINDLIDYVYSNLNRTLAVTQQQSLQEVKTFGHWDLDYYTITGTIHIDTENKILELSEFVNGYPNEMSDPFEDLHVDILNELRQGNKLKELKRKLQELSIQSKKGGDIETIHGTADELLLSYINDKEVTQIFDSIEKWYS